MTLRHRLDGNHAEVRDAFRDASCPVVSLSVVGNGCPDLLVLLPGQRLALVEVKMPAGKLEPDQLRFHAVWPVLVIRSAAEAVELVAQARRNSV